MPCMRDMALSGRSALSVRMVLKAWMPPAPSSEAVKLISDTCNVLVLVLVVEGRALNEISRTCSRYSEKAPY